MKLLCVIIYYENVKINAEYNYEEVPFFSRNIFKESCNFIGNLCLTRTNNNVMFIHENKFVVYSFNSFDFTFVIITDMDYPKRLVLEFQNKLKRDNLKETFKEYQNPTDKILEIPKEFQQMREIETDISDLKNVLLKCIDDVLERNEQIESLIDKSSELSHSSKIFLKQSKKLNRCCVIL